MNFRKYFDLIVLVILLEIISNSSANEWKKLKRKLIALTLLHSIRVKTLIPVPFPIPLPIVIKKDVIPVVLPPKRIPVLVPKPMPYYHVVPNFVPIYAKEADSHEKRPEEENLLPSAQLTYEDYLIPSPNAEGLNPDIYKSFASDVQHPESMHSFYSSEKPNKFNLHPFHNAKHKTPKNKRKLKKQNFKHFDEFKGFNNNRENYENLDMVSTVHKTKPEGYNVPDQIAEGLTQTDHMDINNHRLTTLGDVPQYAVNKQLLSVSKETFDKNRGNGSKEIKIIAKVSPGGKATTKRLRLGEIRLRPNELKAILEHNSQTMRRKM